jgi:hypothetical protein
MALWQLATVDNWQWLCLAAAVILPLALIPITIQVDRWLARRWP